jgi:adenylate cyclase
MFTDLVGYTTLAQRDEVYALSILEKHHELIKPPLAKHGGREVKTMGDAFLIEFRSALEATECAIGIQKAHHEYNQHSTEMLQVKIEIHVGDVIYRGGDIFGHAVNIASRIEPLAEGATFAYRSKSTTRSETRFRIR